MGEEILSLSTIVDRATVNITSKRHKAGKLYELRGLADLGPYEYAKIMQSGAEVDRLRGVKKLTPAQDRHVKKLLDDTVKLICMGIEPSVLAELTDQQKEMIVLTWSQSVRAGAAEGNAQGRSRRTTGGSSPGSKRSTGATRKGGSTRRRGS